MTCNLWSETAAANATADPTINWAEGQAPSTINDSARAMMAALAKYHNDIAGSLTTGGSSTAYTITSRQGLTSLTDGFQIAFQAHAANGASATLQVDSTAAKALRIASGTALPEGVFALGGVYRAVYDSGDDCYYVHGYFSEIAVPTGTMQDYLGTTAPSGFVLASGRTIGDASSSATERANADTSSLFTLLWDAYDNSILAVSGGRGASAAADFAAHKSIALPDLRGRVRAGKDDMGGSAASRLTGGGNGVDGSILGGSGGAQTHTLTTSQTPSHAHTGTTSTGGAHTHSYTKPEYAPANSGSGWGVLGSSSGTTGESGSHSHTFTTNSSGSDGAHNNTQPTWITNVIIKL
jgi:microcystin-dependent protein